MRLWGREVCGERGVCVCDNQDHIKHIVPSEPQAGGPTATASPEDYKFNTENVGACPPPHDRVNFINPYL